MMSKKTRRRKGMKLRMLREKAEHSWFIGLKKAGLPAPTEAEIVAFKKGFNMAYARRHLFSPKMPEKVGDGK